MNTNIFRNLSYGVYILSTLDGERPTGCTVNSIMQISSSPNTIIASVNKNNFTHSCIKESGKFAVSILSQSSSPLLIGNFGFQSGANNNKFDGVTFQYRSGLPVISDSCGYIVCNVINTMETETHTIFLGEVIDCDTLQNSDEAMTYAYYHKVVKSKPTDNSTSSNTNKYICDVCGYVYEGDELPDNYICPICKQGSDKFTKKI